VPHIQWFGVEGDYNVMVMEVREILALSRCSFFTFIAGAVTAPVMCAEKHASLQRVVARVVGQMRIQC
jgi:hypothetical protein